MNCKQRGTQFLSIILALAMVAFVNVPMIAWGVDEPVEPTQSGDVTQAAPIPGDDSQAPSDGTETQTDPAPDPNAAADANDVVVADPDLAATPATAPVEATPKVASTYGPLRVFYALDEGAEQEIGTTDVEMKTSLEALKLDPATFTTLHLRIAAAEGYSFGTDASEQITSVDVGWQSSTADGVVVAKGIALNVNDDGSRTCAIPSELLKDYVTADYDYFHITCDTTAGYPLAFVNYRGYDLFKSGTTPVFNSASLMGAWRTGDGPEIVISPLDGEPANARISDEVDSSGQPISTKIEDVEKSYDANGSLRQTTIKVGASVNAYLAIGDDGNGNTTLTATDNYVYRTSAGEKAGQIAKGTVFARTPVAQVGDIEYTSLKEAVDAATNGQTVTMLDDVTIDATTIEAPDKFYSTIPNGKSITFDLAGKKVTLDMSELIVDLEDREGRTNTERGLFYIAPGGGLTITDSGSNGTITATAPKNTYSIRALIENHGTFTLNGGTVQGVKDVYYLVGTYGLAAHTTITGGTLDNNWGTWKDGGVCLSSNGGKDFAGYKIDISGGTFNGGEQAIYLPSAGTTNITGGTFGSTARAVEIRAGELNITGGTFKATEKRNPGAGAVGGYTGKYTGTLVAVNPKGANEDGYAGDIKINVSGGTFTNTDAGGDAIVVINEQTSDPRYTVKTDISGGTFTGGMNIGDTVSESGPDDFLSVTGSTFPTVRVDTKYYDENVYFQNKQGTIMEPYAITYDLAGGALASGVTNPSSYTDADAFTLANPTKTGYAFAGWTGTDLSAPSKSVTIPAGSTGDRSYVAKWNATPLPKDPSIEVEVPQPPEGDSPYATVPKEAVEAAAEQAQGALKTIKNGDVPAGMSEADAKAVADLIKDAKPDEISVVVSLKFEEKAEDTIDSGERAAIEGVSKDGEEVSLYLDLSVAMTVKVSKASGVKDQKTVSLDEVSEPLLFEVHVKPALIKDKAVRLAHVHGDTTEIINPESVDREQGIIRFFASSFSTYALLTSETVTVTFESNGGTTVDPQTLKFGEKAAKPADPTRAGFVFGGWFSDETLGQAYDFAAPVESSITLYAKWTQNSTIKKLAATGDTTGTLATGAMALTVIAGAALGVAALRRRRSR